ncbi:MAG: hypothetical protein JOS17DRAFT_79773 [Linnemannia elongata]|nr:MAG: hypothetical protein JOS17DRAFT_79773 [Linnemannia elongata]
MSSFYGPRGSFSFIFPSLSPSPKRNYTLFFCLPRESERGRQRAEVQGQRVQCKSVQAKKQEKKRPSAGRKDKGNQDQHCFFPFFCCSFGISRRDGHATHGTIFVLASLFGINLFNLDEETTFSSIPHALFFCDPPPMSRATSYNIPICSLYKAMSLLLQGRKKRSVMIDNLVYHFDSSALVFTFMHIKEKITKWIPLTYLTLLSLV